MSNNIHNFRFKKIHTYKKKFHQLNTISDELFSITAKKKYEGKTCKSQMKIQFWPVLT